jgi:glycosyltransferase involved in cell wall biosynthesis
MKSSISILTYNRKKLSEVAILSVIANTHPRDDYELVVVDNCSDDGTIDMLRDMHNNGVIDKLHVNAWNKNMAVGSNQCIDFAHKEAEWLIHLHNDRYVEPGWYDHIWTIYKDCPFDYAYGQLMGGVTGFKKSVVKLPSGGRILEHDEKMQLGSGLIIKHRVLEETNIRFVERWADNVMGSIYTELHRDFKYYDLVGVEMARPCVLFQNCEFNNPEYEEYYNKFFDDRGTRFRLDETRNRNGYFESKEDIDSYYMLSGYDYYAGASKNIEILKEKIGA